MKNKNIYVKSASGKVEKWLGGRRQILKDYFDKTGENIKWEDYLFSVGNYSVVDGRKYRSRCGS